MPAIVCMAALCGALVAWNVADLAAAVKARRAAQVAESNLDQAEGMFVACVESKPFAVGSAIYIPRTRLSELTTAHVVEMRGDL